MNESDTTIEQIIAQTLQQRADGQNLTDEEVTGRYPQHMPQLADELRKLRLIGQAREQADHPADVMTWDQTRSGEFSTIGDDPEDAPAAPSVHVPDYELLHWIGRGGFGEVWLARHRIHGEFCAVKIVPKSHAAELDGVRAYKQRASSHPGLIPIEHVGELEQAYYYVMPLADDVKPASAVRAPDAYEPKSLEWCLANLPPMSPDEVIAIAMQLLGGLETLHQAGLTHCDVKPANIMSLGGQWRLGDLGLMSPTEHVGATRGTVAFWPPEGPGDPTADLYALGITLFLLLSGGEYHRLSEFLSGDMELHGDPVQLDRLRDVLSRACHADPGLRYRSATSMREALAAPLPKTRAGSHSVKRTAAWLAGGLVVLILAVIAFELQEKWQGRPPGDHQTVGGHQGNAASGQKPDHSRSPNVEVQASPDSDFLPLIRIQTGEYSMGSPGGEEGRGDHEGPQRQIRISQSFLIGQHEVTQAQFESVMQTNPSVHRGPDLPVDSVTWNEAVTFCQRLSDREGRRYRLPTEAEWEYACRAGSTTAYAWGSEWTPAAAALQTGGPGQELETPARVGSYPASSWGLFDMHGNVWEWCQDRWSENFRQSRLKPGSPGSAHDQFPVIRGGSWRDAPRNGRSASRQPLSPGTRRDDVGFRVVRDG